jgi:hypothetical protein
LEHKGLVEAMKEASSTLIIIDTKYNRTFPFGSIDRLFDLFPKNDCFIIVDDASTQVEITKTLEDNKYDVSTYYGVYCLEKPLSEKGSMADIVTIILQ